MSPISLSPSSSSSFLRLLPRPPIPQALPPIAFFPHSFLIYASLPSQAVVQVLLFLPSLLFPSSIFRRRRGSPNPPTHPPMHFPLCALDGPGGETGRKSCRKAGWGEDLPKNDRRSGGREVKLFFLGSFSSPFFALTQAGSRGTRSAVVGREKEEEEGGGSNMWSLSCRSLGGWQVG